MSEAASVAIIIPCYRQARFLRRAIESAMAQTVDAAEIIVVDDGSPDHPERVTARFPRVQLVRRANGGPGAARNSGVAAAASEKVIFLDADDRLLPGAVAAGLVCFAENPDAAFVYGGFRHVRWLREGDYLRQARSRCDLIRNNWVGMIATVMFDRAKLLKVGGFDEGMRICEDWDLFLRLSRQFPFAVHEEIVATYVRHRGNITNDRSKVLSWIEVARAKERERGLSQEEAKAWDEGAAVVAAAYPTASQRVKNLVRRLRGRRP